MRLVSETEFCEEIIARILRTTEKLDRMAEVLALRHAAETTSATVTLNVLDGLLAELQLLASSIIVGELKDQAVRPALMRFAKRFEELDGALTGGLPLPGEWQKRRRS